MAQDKLSLKFGWLPVRNGLAGLALAAVAATGAGASKIVFAGGGWAAIDFGSRCEARSKPMWSKPETAPYAGFAFDRGGARQGQFYVHLGRAARPGASVIATIGIEPFLLGGNGEWGWSRNIQQQSAMIEAARAGGLMRIDSRDARGGRIVDRYPLAGAPSAIDAAAAACAGKSG